MDVTDIFSDCAPMQPPRKSEISKTAAKRANRGKIIAFLEKNRGKPQFRPTPSAGMAVNRVVRPLSKKFGPGVSAIKSHWPQIIGEKWAKLSRPVAIRGNKDGKSLIIEAQGPAATLIQANAAQLLDKINQFLGAGAISKLKVQQASIQSFNKIKTSKAPIEDAKDVQSGVETGADNEIKAALNKLGKKIRARDTQ